MPIEMPRGFPFAVDTWTPASSLKRHRFLTHAHRDHLAGIAATAAVSASSPVYASRLTILIALRIFPQLDRAAFVELEVGAPPLRVPDPDGDFAVTAFDANHCPGAVMFLFEGPFGTVLHTGDCRLTPDCLSALTARRIDYLFLDCTFARCPLHFPTKEDSIRQVINCIWNHPSAPAVYLVCDMLGQEDVLVEVSRAFGSKIYVDRDKNSDCHHTLTHVAPEILADADADDAAPSSSRFHVVPFPRLSERATEILALARARCQPEPLIIRPSSQWYAYYEPPESSTQHKPVLTEPMRDEFGVWHVCLSMHSSRDELEQALGILKPKWAVSTTPPCMAVDLSYVRKHCSLSRFGLDDPLWKLLGIPDGMSTVAGSAQAVLTVDAVEESEECFSSCIDDDKRASDNGSQAEAAEAMPVDFEIRVDPPVTLFGSVRFGLLQHDSELWKHEHVEMIGAVELEAKDSATETGRTCNNSKPDESAGFLDLTEAVTKEKHSVSESELLKDSKYDDGIEAVGLTEQGKKELNLSAKPEQYKDDKGSGEAQLEAQEQNVNIQAHLTVERRHKMEMTKEISAVHVTVSATVNKEATEDDTITSKIWKNSDQDSARVRDSSSLIGSSKGLNPSLRRLYRSMNVSVPRPLPSLVELMEASKRPRVS
ncbi:hypothetical protein U9M48_041284 [Paspalum notatum var. saurae]|uniref:DNA repair metallo-beta-lactamase domain-containing protein n=1 Tax=Paspalum notatum var. saurae TaxID=547442 RepID=A0AAQ3XF41_PASNO